MTVAHRRRDRRAIGLPLPELNLGSGFDIACRPGDEPLDIDRVAAALNHTLCNAPPLLATTRFTIELGRWLVGEAGVYLTRVVDRTESCGQTFLTTDGGGHHLIGATGSLGERGTANFPIAVANRFGAPPEEEVTVTGCLCTPFDVLGDEVVAAARGVGRPDRGLLRRRLRPERKPAGMGKPPAGPRNAGLGVDRLDEIQSVRRRIEARAPPGRAPPAPCAYPPAAIARARPSPGSRPSTAPDDGGSCAPRRSMWISSPTRLDLQPVERLHRAVRLAMRRAEGGEVMPSDQVRRAFAHRLDVERRRRCATRGRRPAPAARGG